jgi:hypothetical protein
MPVGMNSYKQIQKWCPQGQEQLNNIGHNSFAFLWAKLSALPVAYNLDSKVSQRQHEAQTTSEIGHLFP